VKLLADGRVVWQTTYETNAVDYANAVVGGDDPLVVGALEQGGTESARLVKLAGESSTLEPQIDYAPSDPGTGEDVTFLRCWGLECTRGRYLRVGLRRGRSLRDDRSKDY